MNKTKASDQYVVISTPAGLSKNYSDPKIKTFVDYGHAFGFVQSELIALCSQGLYIANEPRNLDDASRRTYWYLDDRQTEMGDDHIVRIIKIQPYEIEVDKYKLPKYMLYDQIHDTVEWLFDYVECRCHVSTIALESRGFDRDFMKFNERTHELYEHVFIELDDMDDGKQIYVTLDDDDVCMHYYKIQYHEEA